MTKAISTQRLATLKKELANIAQGVRRYGERVGAILIEIDDQHLYEADGCHDIREWIGEHAELFQYSPKECYRLLNIARIDEKRTQGTDRSPEISTAAKKELIRLAPQKSAAHGHGGMERDVSRIRKGDIKRVEKRAAELAAKRVAEQSNGKKKNQVTPTVADVRQAVDIEIGYDRDAERRKRQAEQDKREREARARAQRERQREEAKRELGNYLTDLAIQLKEVLRNLKKVSGEGWEQLEASKPGICERLAKGCDELSVFLREG